MAEPPGAPTSARRDPPGDRANPPTEGVHIGAERADRADAADRADRSARPGPGHGANERGGSARGGKGRGGDQRGGSPRGGRVTGGRRSRVRARRVHRVVRHIEPWSVLKVSVLFYLVLFLIICVASAVLWGVGRSSGAIANVEDVITELGVFGECEPVEGGAPTTTVAPETDDPLDQLTPPAELDADAFDLDELDEQRDDDGCLPGEEFVGGFRFEGAQLFAAFALGGLVLVVAGSVFNVVLAVLFNLISDLTGGVRVTVLEEEPRVEASGRRTGSPGGRDSG